MVGYSLVLYIASVADITLKNRKVDGTRFIVKQLENDMTDLYSENVLIVKINLYKILHETKKCSTLREQIYKLLS